MFKHLSVLKAHSIGGIQALNQSHDLLGQLKKRSYPVSPIVSFPLLKQIITKDQDLPCQGDSGSILTLPIGYPLMIASKKTWLACSHLGCLSQNPPQPGRTLFSYVSISDISPEE